MLVLTSYRGTPHPVYLDTQGIDVWIMLTPRSAALQPLTGKLFNNFSSKVRSRILWRGVDYSY
jgi:hypothetical protein